MGSYFCVELADVLRAAGLTVGESRVNAGWQTRSRISGGFASKAAIMCCFWHHTASSTTPERDLTYMVNGTGHPIGNMLIARDGVCWPIAAGASNCAGKGGPVTLSRGVIPADTGNTRGWQIEVANNGIGEAWPTVQVDAFFKASNALNAHFGNLPTDIVTHAVGAGDGWTARKIDPARADAVQGSWRPRSVTSSGTWSLADVRSEARARAGTLPPPTPPPDPDPDTRPPLPPDTEDIMRLICAQDSAGAYWIGDGLQRRWIDDEATFNNYVLQANNGNYQLVNTSAKAVRGFADVHQVADATVDALGAPIGG